MTPRSRLIPVLLAPVFFSDTCHALWITNFDSLTAGAGGSASGVWRDVTNTMTGAGNDTSFAVSLSTDGEVKAADGSSLTSRLDETFPWRDLQAGETFDFEGTTIGPLPIAFPLPFANGSNGDFINIETDSGNSSLVIIDFGATITDPILSFSDIDTDTTMTFTDAFSVVAMTPNLSSGALSVSNAGFSTLPPFDQEAAGSLQFSGTYTQLQFTITNGSVGTEDRTGFVVSTQFEPVPEPSAVFLLLSGLGLIGWKRRR